MSSSRQLSSRQLPVVTTESDNRAAEHTRRQFCLHTCQAASLAAVAAVLQACGSSNPTGPSSVPAGAALAVLSGSVSGNTVSVSVVAGGPLAASGGAALVSAAIGSGAYLVARTSATTFNVMTAICTHQGCTVDEYSGSQFICSCHGSRYTTSGAVANGPALLPLQMYPSTFANETLMFTV